MNFESTGGKQMESLHESKRAEAETVLDGMKRRFGIRHNYYVVVEKAIAALSNSEDWTADELQAARDYYRAKRHEEA